MRIYCPKCKTGYEIDGDLIPEEGKKLRCSYCQTVFTATKADLREEPNFPELKKQAKPDESETAEVTDGATDTSPEKTVDDEVMKGIFQRLSTQTENLFEAEKKVPLGKKIISKVKRSLGLKYKVNRYLSLAAIVAFLGLILYNYRFDIVRTLPFMNNIYAAVGVRAWAFAPKFPGKGWLFKILSGKILKMIMCVSLKSKALSSITAAGKWRFPFCGWICWIKIPNLCRFLIRSRQLRRCSPAGGLLSV